MVFQWIPKSHDRIRTLEVPAGRHVPASKVVSGAAEIVSEAASVATSVRQSVSVATLIISLVVSSGGSSVVLEASAVPAATTTAVSSAVVSTTIGYVNFNNFSINLSFIELKGSNQVFFTVELYVTIALRMNREEAH